MADVPPLAEFLRWINEMPSEFLEEPAGFPNGKVLARAVVADLYETLFKRRADDEFLRAFAPAKLSKLERNRLLWVMAACHVCWHPAIRNCEPPVAGLRKLFVQDLAALAAIVPIDNLIGDQDRREELVRRVLSAMGLCFPNETAGEFSDRLAQVDSIEIQRVIADAAVKEKRARREREVREEMARKAAEEAAAKASRE
ncbi:MAG TPA: hypothetical protein VKX17_27255 [Planctomycetota bacterium]|nr:hypothetical protein [Planctomycetota bacterium]